MDLHALTLALDEEGFGLDEFGFDFSEERRLIVYRRLQSKVRMGRGTARLIDMIWDKVRIQRRRPRLKVYQPRPTDPKSLPASRLAWALNDYSGPVAYCAARLPSGDSVTCTASIDGRKLCRAGFEFAKHIADRRDVREQLRRELEAQAEAERRASQQAQQAFTAQVRSLPQAQAWF